MNQSKIKLKLILFLKVKLQLIVEKLIITNIIKQFNILCVFLNTIGTKFIITNIIVYQLGNNKYFVLKIQILNYYVNFNCLYLKKLNYILNLT
jgi:hypothetical protein